MLFSRIGKVLPLVVLMIPAAAQAKPRWKTVYTGDGLMVAVDTAAISKNTDGSYSVWTRWDYTQPRLLENKKSYTRLVERADLKCAPIAMKRANTALYNATGKVVKAPEELGAEEVAAMSWDPPRKGSDGEQVWVAVCKDLKGRKNR